MPSVNPSGRIHTIKPTTAPQSSPRSGWRCIPHRIERHAPAKINVSIPESAAHTRCHSKTTPAAASQNQFEDRAEPWTDHKPLTQAVSASTIIPRMADQIQGAIPRIRPGDSNTAHSGEVEPALGWLGTKAHWPNWTRLRA